MRLTGRLPQCAALPSAARLTGRPAACAAATSDVRWYSAARAASAALAGPCSAGGSTGCAVGCAISTAAAATAGCTELASGLAAGGAAGAAGSVAAAAAMAFSWMACAPQPHHLSPSLAKSWKYILTQTHKKTDFAAESVCRVPGPVAGGAARATEHAQQIQSATRVRAAPCAWPPTRTRGARAAAAPARWPPSALPRYSEPAPCQTHHQGRQRPSQQPTGACTRGTHA